MIFIPQPLKAVAVGIMFSPVVSCCMGGQAVRKYCPGCMSETMRYGKFILDSSVVNGFLVCGISFCFGNIKNKIRKEYLGTGY